MILTSRSTLLVALLVLLAVILQGAYFSQVELLGTSIWILPGCVAVFGLLGGSLVGATVGFGLGFLADGLGGGPLGSSALIFMGVGYLAGLYRERGARPDRLTIIGIFGLATAAANLTLGTYVVLVGFDASLSPAFILDFLIQSIYAMLLALPLYALIHRVLRAALIHERPVRKPATTTGFGLEDDEF